MKALERMAPIEGQRLLRRYGFHDVLHRKLLADKDYLRAAQVCLSVFISVSVSVSVSVSFSFSFSVSVSVSVSSCLTKTTPRYPAPV